MIFSMMEDNLSLYKSTLMSPQIDEGPRPTVSPSGPRGDFLIFLSRTSGSLVVPRVQIIQGLVMSIFFWGYMMTQYMGGMASDRYGGEMVIFYSTSIWSIVTILFVWLPDLILLFDYEFTSLKADQQGVDNSARLSNSKDERIYVAFILCRFVQGCSQGFFYPSLASLLSKRVDLRQKQLIFPIITSGSHLGTLLCGAFGSYISQNYGWRLAFHFIGCLSLFWAFIMHNQIKKSSRYKEKAVLWANLVYSNTFYILLNWMPTYFNDNYPDARSWVFNFIPWLIICPSVIMGSLLTEEMSRRGLPTIYSRKFLNTITLIGSSVFLNLLHFFDDYTTCLILMALAIACCGFHNSGILLNAQEITTRNCGQVYGIISTIGTIPGFCSVYLTGYIIDKTHDWTLVFQITGLLNVSGWIVYSYYGRASPIF